MNIPNLLTLFRLFLIPVFILFFFSQINNSLIISIAIFLFAGFTDILDGYIARKYNLVTRLGMVLDPLADKLMLLTVLTCFVINNYTSLWILLIISLKEIFMIISAFLLYKNNIVIPSNILGKISTLLFYLSIFLLSLDVNFGKYILYIAVISAVAAFINYIFIYVKGRLLEPVE